MKKDQIMTSIDFEYLLSNLLGKKNYHGCSGLFSLPDYKTKMYKIIKSLKNSIEETIISTDSKHLYQLHGILDIWKESVTKSKHFDQLNEANLLYLVKLNFTILGNMPDNWFQSRANKPEHWKLSKYRTICFHQNLEQKVNLIHSLPYDTRYKDKLPKTRELLDKHMELKTNKAFYEWFKTNYKEIYLEIF